MDNEFIELDDQKITVEVDGEMVEYDLMFTYDSEANDRTIIGYTDHSRGDNGAINIFVGQYDPLLGPNTLEPITDPEDAETCKRVIQDIVAHYKK